MELATILMGVHFLFGGFLVGFDWVRYRRSKEDIDEMFMINRIVFVLLWEIAILCVIYAVLFEGYSMGEIV